MLRSGSRTFFAASHVLPAGVQHPATALYAFCRQADDAIDIDGGGMHVLDSLRARVARAYEGRPHASPVDRAFADVVTRFAIPPTLPKALLEGMEWDVDGRRYEDIGDLFAYAARVAGSVGAMMSLLMERRAPELVARACDLGVAMQLTNIARDVGEDAREGRVYLPLRWLREAGIDPEAWLASPSFDVALGSVIQRLLNVADTLYERAGIGISGLPAACRPGIYAARYLYAEIGREVERNGLDSLSRRAAVPPFRKIQLLACAISASVVPARRQQYPVLDQTRFLVDSVVAANPPSRVRRPSDAPWWKLGERGAWVVDLCERLERREAAARQLGG